MDADPPTTAVTLSRAIDPFSGMALVRVSGYWQAPAGRTTPAAVEVWYDLGVAIRDRLTPSAAPDVPPGHVRHDFGTQLPVEAGVQEIAVVLVGPAGPQLVYRGPLATVGAEALPPRAGLLVLFP
ncbi:MAG: hypothetical protein K2X87_29120, partial [Gemmataceae bacterium]|nr:hypothetical protein [Gemmataceae bacterium]